MPFTTNFVGINAVHSEVYSIQHYVIKFISDLRQVGGFLQVLFSSTNKSDRHDIIGILLKVVLNTITLNLNVLYSQTYLKGHLYITKHCL